MKITMDKKWAQRADPTKEVRVLCVDSGNAEWPIIYLDDQGTPYSSMIRGSWLGEGEEHPNDLVPLQEKVADVWIAVRNNGTITDLNFPTKQAANTWIDNSGANCFKPYSVVRMTQAEEKS